MNKIFPIMAMAFLIMSCHRSKSAPEQVEALADTLSVPADSVLEGEDVEGDFGGLNAIRFNDFTEDDWNDNEYIRCLRQYITDYNEGKVKDENLDACKNKIRGKFAVLSIGPCIGGGAFIYIVFLDSSDDIFYCWVYSTVDEEKKAVVSYSVHSISLTDEKSGLTKEDILEIIKEHPENKVW